jgi:endonuclease/exonuclease/phosphatase (EEP) superfamily protein YafD
MLYYGSGSNPEYVSSVDQLKHLKYFSQVFLAATSILVLFVSLASFLGAVSPLIDIFSHFRWQYTVMLALSSVLLLLSHRRKLAATMVLGALANAPCLLILYIPARTVESTRTKDSLSILNMNLQTGNMNYELVDNAIHKYAPDVITLQELTPWMCAHLKSVLNDYPYQFLRPRTDPYGIGIFSKRKLVRVDENPLKLLGSLVIQGDIEVNSMRISILPIHACGPTSSVGCELDKNIADSLAKFRAEFPNRSVILIGDMNSTPWSNIFRQLKNTAKFRDSERGFGLQCSWPVGIPLLAIPIDHCFYTPDWSCKSRVVGAFVGSDHYPLFVQLEHNHN